MAVFIQSPSTIKELRIETASANAEFGDGSNFVNVITKSGTNDLHGDILSPRKSFPVVQHELFPESRLRHVGNAGQGILNDPGINNWNMTLWQGLQDP